MPKVENPAAFKHWISPALLKRLAAAILTAHPDFNRRRFLAIAPELEPLELKQRVARVREALRAELPADFPRALRILLSSLRAGTLSNFDLWPYTEFVQTYGLEHFDESMEALKKLTVPFTSEFAVRPFLKKYPRQTLKLLTAWCTDSDERVRRWTSEGTRPRLPWGEKLPTLIADPAPALLILEKLRWDDALYVRKSVANHLNDIAKDHPELVVKTLRRWQSSATGARAPKFDFIRRQALRTLIKRGHLGALALMGVTPDAPVRVNGLRLATTDLRVGGTLEFSFELRAKPGPGPAHRLIVDYAIHHVRADGGTRAKVFKLRTFELAAGERIAFTRRHSLRLITTRTYYSGTHLLEVIVNGRTRARAPWRLLA